MGTPAPLMPRKGVPALDLPLVGGGRFVLGEEPPERFDLLIFYRGVHCPVCTKYLAELGRLAPEFEKRGVMATAISCDDADKAAEMTEKTHAGQVAVAHSLPLKEARSWGLYLSAARPGSAEPALFSEPGVFLVCPDATLYYGATQTMPFARPGFSDLLSAVDYAMSKDYPARGDYAGET